MSISIQDYRPDVRFAPSKAMEENWHLLESNDESGVLDIRGEA